MVLAKSLLYPCLAFVMRNTNMKVVRLEWYYLTFESTERNARSYVLDMDIAFRGKENNFQLCNNLIDNRSYQLCDNPKSKKGKEFTLIN